jgi:hypothetical protein
MIIRNISIFTLLAIFLNGVSISSALAIDIWISPAEIAQLPNSGAAWNRVKSDADGSFSSSNHGWETNTTNDTRALAAALVAARIGLTTSEGIAYREKVADELMAAIRDPNWDDYHAMTYASRTVPSYVIAADIIDFPNLPGYAAEELEFRTFFSDWRFNCQGDQSNFEQMADRPNNKGTMAFAAEAAILVYLIKNGVPSPSSGIPGTACVPDRSGQFSLADLTAFYADPQLELNEVARMFEGYLGNRSRYDGYDFATLDISSGDDDWQHNTNESFNSGTGNGYGINPQGSTRDGNSIDGVMPDDQRRSGGFSWPPPKENYVYTGMSGIVVAAAILARQGFDVWNWENQAIKRSWEWLHTPHFPGGTTFPCTDSAAGSNDGWQAWIVNQAYGTDYPKSSSSTGFNMAWTEWTHAGAIIPPSNVPAPPTNLNVTP